MENVNLFGESIAAPRRYNRDRGGRFASVEVSKLEQAERKAAAYRIMFEVELSRAAGFWKIIRQKDNEIERLKNYIKKIQICNI